ncbi:MAG: DegT/DnrJ/EryC1/StrS family aminotransferase, partial [Thermodesulfobacteriota bacterium]
EAFRVYVGCKHAVALSSATGGLHLGLMAMGIGPGDEVITSPMTFAATVNQIVLCGAVPVLVDVDGQTLMIDVDRIEEKITGRTAMILPVHFAGAPVEMDTILDLAKKHHLKVLEDAAHGLGTRYKDRPVGPIGDGGVFSFHPIKNMTTAEGGMFVTDDGDLASRVRLLKFHGLSAEAWQRYHRGGAGHYDVMMPGYKYNMTDLQASLGIHQLAKLDTFNRRRAELASLYDRLLAPVEAVELPGRPSCGHRHGWHLYVIRLSTDRLRIDRDAFMRELKARNIGTGLHFKAVHLHDYYARTLGYARGSLPIAEDASDRIMSLPLFPDMAEEDVRDVVSAIEDIVRLHGTKD